jgi:trehalose 6-phosphate phosphatase
VEPLAQLASEPEKAALLFDIDGTLAPIVERPEDARVPEDTRVELRRLAGAYGLVACVSGRPGAVAREIVGVDGVVYVGEHGLELDPEADVWAARIRRFKEETAWPDEGKPLSAAFHYRTHPDHEAAEAALRVVAERALEQGFRTRWGRMVLEVLPPLESSKGTAVRWLLERHGLGRALFAGDDTTDLDAFRALDGLDLAVRVAVVSAEGPSALGEAADVVLGGTGALLQLLRRL